MPIFPQGVPQTRDASGLGASSYTGRILEAEYANAVSPRVSSALGAVEASVGLWSRCLSLCQAKPTGRRELSAITPSFLALAGRELALRGRFVARIVVRGGRVRLLPSAYVNAFGGVDPADWRYTLSSIGASHTETVTNLQASEVIDIRYSQLIRDIDRGRSPLQNAHESVRLLFGATRSAGNEFAVGVARIIAGKDALAVQQPGSTTSQEQVNAITKNINDAISNDPGVKYHKAGEIEVHRIGAEVDKGTTDVLSAAEASVYAAFGIPPQLFVGDTASGLREAWRAWRITVDALAALVSEELRAKLHPEAELSTAALRLTDLTAIARSVHSLTQSGLSVEDALRKVGLDDDLP